MSAAFTTYIRRLFDLGSPGQKKNPGLTRSSSEFSVTPSSVSLSSNRMRALRPVPDWDRACSVFLLQVIAITGKVADEEDTPLSLWRSTGNGSPFASLIFRMPRDEQPTFVEIAGDQLSLFRSGDDRGTSVQ